MNILCPTDFSNVATFAYEVAAQLAKDMNATLYLFHCRELQQNWSGNEEWNEQFDPFQEAAAKASDEQLRKLQEALLARKVNCEVRSSEGDFFEQLELITQEIPFNFVVMGSHGAGGKREWLIGSNTQKAIRRLHLNTLVVKAPLKNLEFPKAVFATGLLLEDQVAFRRFLELTSPLGIKVIHLLTIHTSGLFTPPQIVIQEALKDFQAIAEGYQCETHFYEGISIEAGIRRFIEEEKADLVAISNHVRQPLKRIFRGSTVEMLINHADVPVLSIDYPAEV